MVAEPADILLIKITALVQILIHHDAPQIKVTAINQLMVTTLWSIQKLAAWIENLAPNLVVHYHIITTSMQRV